MKNIIIALLLSVIGGVVYSQQPINAWFLNNSYVDSMGNVNLADKDADTELQATTYYEATHAMVADGDNGSLRTTAPINVGNQFSISMWIRANADSDYDYVLSNATSGSDDGFSIGFDVGDDYNNVKFDTYGGSTIDRAFTGNYVFTDATWFHLVVSANRSTGYAQIYIDGIKQTSADSSIRTDFAVNDTIALGGYRAFTTSDKLKGYIDNVQIYNYRLSSLQIDSLYDNGSTSFILYDAAEPPASNPLLDSLIAYYDFTSAAAPDIHSGNYDATTVYNTTHAYGSYIGGDYFMSLNGYNSYIELPPIPLTGKTGSANMWIKMDDETTPNQALISRHLLYDVLYVDNTTFNSYINFSAQLSGGTATGDWAMVTWVYTGTKARLYLNGVRVDSADYSTAWAHEAYNWQIGRVSSNDYFYDGIFDELAFWSDALTQSEITTLWNGGYVLKYDQYGEGTTPPEAQTGYYETYHAGVEYHTYHEGIRYLFYYGGGEAPEEPSYEDYTVLFNQDFEGQALGAVDAYDLYDMFNTDDAFTNSGELTIVEDVINGVTTNVMKMRVRANDFNEWFEVEMDVPANTKELYLTYNFKWDTTYRSSRGGKLPGRFRGLPEHTLNAPPTVNQGWSLFPNFIEGTAFSRYTYDHRPTVGVDNWYSVRNYEFWNDANTEKWVTEFLNPGNWYAVTIRVVINTFTGGVGNLDGIYELWLDGRNVISSDNVRYSYYQSVNDTISTVSVMLFTGGDEEYVVPQVMYGLLDNFTLWTPNGSTVIGNEAYPETYVLPTPYEVTPQDFIYDELITSAGTFTNSEWGDYYGWVDEVYVIDAGAGKTVEMDINSMYLGSKDLIIVYDGKTTDSEVIDYYWSKFNASQADIVSTGRYMTVRFLSSNGSSTLGFTSTLTFN